MMTKEQHVEYWVNTAEEDWITVDIMFNTKRYLHCLFWTHLTLEKLAKAHWVKNHQENIPPRVHSIVWLLVQSDIDLGEETMDFLEGFNKFQLSGRYPDYTNRIYKICTKEYTYDHLEKVKEVRKCLLEMLQ
jgi:HEPN domain-containing protein